MKKLVIAACFVASLVALAADRASVSSEASIKVYQTNLIALPDGGCAAQAYATVTTTSGVVVKVDSEASVATELSGANRVSCLDVLGKSLQLFKTTNGF